MAYTITFVDRASRTYTLTLTTPTGSGALTGGAATIETNEDVDTDMFMPVRCQTGSFRYLGKNDHATWMNLIPADSLSIPVKLERGSTIVWQGYIQPQVFENEYPGLATVEHVFPIQCPLSVLDTLDIDPNPNGANPTINTYPTISFAQLLKTFIFDRLTGTTIRYFYIQGTMAVVSARLAIKVMWANFLEVDSNNAVVCKYTAKQVLEEFCKFFGYTCRIHGQDVFFTQPTGNSVGFTRYSTETDSLTGPPTPIARGSFNLTDAMIIGMDHNETIIPGIGKATVRSNINELDNLIEIPYDELFDRYNAGLPAGTQQDPRIIIRSVDWYSHNVYNLIRQPDTDGGHLIYDNDNVSLDVYMQTKPGTGDNAGNQKRYGRFFVYDDNDVGGDITTQQIPESKGQFSWRKCIEIFHSHVSGTPSSSTPSFKITSKQVFVISDGMLYINFKCHEVSAWLVGNENVETYPKAMCSLKIGSNTYWNGSAWVQSDSLVTFDLSFTSDGAKTNRPSYRQAYGGDIVNVPQYDGYGAKVDGTMRGNIEFSVIDVSPFATIDWEGSQVAYINGFLPLLDFEIGFVRGVIEDTQHRGNEYTVNGGAFRDEVNVDLIWASDQVYGPQNYQRHMPAGLGYILNSQDKPTGNIQSMGGAGVNPERELASIIANYGQTTHRVVTLTLKSSLLGDVNPTAFSTGLESGLFPLAISHNWRDDTVQLTLIDV